MQGTYHNVGEFHRVVQMTLFSWYAKPSQAVTRKQENCNNTEITNYSVVVEQLSRYPFDSMPAFIFIHMIYIIQVQGNESRKFQHTGVSEAKYISDL